MSAAYYIILEKEDTGIDLNVYGRGISRDQEVLDKIAQDIGIKPLSNFYSIDVESVLDLIGEDITSLGIPDEYWFDSREGLITIQLLLNYITNNNSGISKSTVTELQNYERILKEAVIHNTRWHLAIDI